MKRMVLLWMVLMLIMLAACTPADTLTSDEKERDSVTISFFQPGLEQPNAKKPVEKLIKHFEEENPGIKVDIQSVGWGESYQKLVTGFSSGTAPDVIHGGTRWVGAFAAMNGILPLDEYAEEKLSLYHDPLQKAVTYKDNIYAIPRSFSARAIIYRSDLIPEPPKTWDELVEVAKKVQKKKEGMYGFAVAGAKHVSTTTQFFNYVFQNGGNIFDEDGNVLLNSQESVEALEYYADLYTKHKVVPNPIEYNREQLPILFKEGKIAMFVCGPWAKAIMGTEPDNPETPYKTAVLPKGKEMSNTLVSDSLMVSAKTEHPKAAWKLIEFMTSQEEQKKHDKDQGLVPIQKEEAKDPFFKKDPYFAPFVEMATMGQRQPVPAAWEPFQDIVSEAVQKALNGENPQKALDEAVEKIKKEKLAP